MLTFETEIEEEQFYDVLSNARRRECIKLLRDDDGPVTVSKLTSYIASVEADEPDERLEKSIYVALRQTHLPKLAELGVVEYDPDSNVVSAGSAFSQFDRAEGRPSTKPYWVYFLLSVMALAWFAAVYTGLVLLTLG